MFDEILKKNIGSVWKSDFEAFLLFIKKVESNIVWLSF
jgi:hypothetical protein